MRDFYRGGNHDKTLNENMDSSLFDETFIVFEIDSIKDDPLLFPLVTLIIMDVFLQKMRIKKIIFNRIGFVLMLVKRFYFCRKKRKN